MSPRDCLIRSARSLLAMAETADQIPQEAAEDVMRDIRGYLAACVVTHCPPTQAGVSAGTIEEARRIYGQATDPH